ncbi:MAG: 4a-hydroxytetrahydrobiopterin dehydratase [Actinomycetota bacterium]
MTSVEWAEDADGMHREFVFRDFSEAWAFMTRVAHLAEQMNHHPDWSNSWNLVSITLISHDVGRVTDRDRELAEAIDSIHVGGSEGEP